MESCKLLQEVQNVTWRLLFVSSAFVCVFRFFTKSVLLFFILFLLSIYLGFGKDWEATRISCDDVATTQVCASLRQFNIPTSCHYEEVQAGDYECEAEKWIAGYTPAFFSTCTQNGFNQPLFNSRCKESPYFFSFFVAMCTLGLELALSQFLFK